jgi:L-ascorbate metabolism protein UlaG (beta-lactamase superfamily)
VTLEKNEGPALDIAALGTIDAVLLSHDQHADNLDHAGRALLRDVPVVLTTNPGAERLGGSARELAPWQTVDLPGPAGTRLTATATPARHGPVGIEPMSGEVVGFLVGVEQPGDAIYITRRHGLVRRRGRGRAPL